MASPVAPNSHVASAPLHPSAQETQTEPCIFHRTLDSIKSFVTKDLVENIELVKDIAMLGAIFMFIILQQKEHASRI